jgi:glycogen debranching enzyme
MKRLDMAGRLLAVACWMVLPSAIAGTPAGNATAEASRAPTLPVRAAPTLDSLAVPVARASNRAVSFTNRRSAFYYTQTHVNEHPEHAWFRGLSIAGRRIFSDYQITVDGEALDPALASTVVVRPDELRRTHPSGITETLRLYDDRDVVGIEVTGAHGDADLALAGDMLRADSRDGGDRFYTSAADTAGAPGMAVAVRRSGRIFLICAAATRASAAQLCAEAARDEPRWRAERQARLSQSIRHFQYVWTDDPALTDSLRWIALTTEQLVTRQRGDGIFAGLPWFPEYWGRDSFIALPGATLVTGRFEAARAILSSFATFQDRDPKSPFFGRVPNIVKPGSLDYHTTDGTPRFVLALQDYLRYTGDDSLMRELYPAVVASIDGSLARFTDEHGLLVHADNETWMDARRASDLAAYAPRGSRANDIQALWYGQLLAGVDFAQRVGDLQAAERWRKAAERARQGFQRLFVSTGDSQKPPSVADHVTAPGVADHTLRPNVLFALDLVPAGDAAQITARAWRTLVFPWGVTTLDPGDPGFHPYHFAPDCWHKDAAYHNGAVWPWLDGIAIERMVEFGQVERAWQLFRARSRLALERGVVGGLPENLDAHPHPGETEPRLTGTYLQAWSNTEHLRAWYQAFLGVRPMLDHGRIELAPRLPAALGDVDFESRIGAGSLRGVYTRTAQGRRYHWVVHGLDTTVALDLPGFEPQLLAMRAGDQLVVTASGDSSSATHYSAEGQRRHSLRLIASPTRRSQQAAWDGIFAGVGFAMPRRLGQDEPGLCTPASAGTGGGTARGRWSPQSPCVCFGDLFSVSFAPPLRAQQ